MEEAFAARATLRRGSWNERLRIHWHTQKAFGQAINPHLFHDAAATTLAIADPEHVRVAALLGHCTFTTTERYYQQAQSLGAHRAYIEALYSKTRWP